MLLSPARGRGGVRGWRAMAFTLAIHILRVGTTHGAGDARHLQPPHPTSPPIGGEEHESFSRIAASLQIMI